MECAQPSHGAGERKPSGSGIPKLRKSCDPCSLAKRRCDGQPQCSLCVKKGIHCIYGERQKSGPKGRKGLAAASTQRQQLLLQQQQHQQQQQLNQGQRHGSVQPPGRRRGPFVPAQPTRTGDITGDAPPPPSQTRPHPHPATDERSPLDATTSSARHILDSSSDGSIDGKDRDVRTMVIRAPPSLPSRGGAPPGVSSGAEHRHGHSGGGVGDSSSTDPMQPSWAARDGGLPHYGPAKINGGGRGMRGNDGAFQGRNSHTENDKKNGGGSFGALVRAQPNLGEDNHRTREFPNKFRRTAEKGWPSRARQDSAVDHEPSRSQLQENDKVKVDIMVRPYSGPDSSDGPTQHPGGRGPDSVDSPHHRQQQQQQQQQQWSTGQRRPVSPSHVSRPVSPSHVQSHGTPAAVATNCQGVEPYQNGPGAEDDQSWRSAGASWQTRRPPSAGGVAPTGMSRDGNGRVTSSMAYSAQSGSNGGNEERGRAPGSGVGYPMASTPPADISLTTEAARGDGRRVDMTTVALPSKESVAVRSPPSRVASRIEERPPNTDHQHPLQEQQQQQQQQQNQAGSSGRYQVNGRPVYEGGGEGATTAVSTAAVAASSSAEVGGAWQYDERAGVVVPRSAGGSVPRRWNEYEYWQPERGVYQRWDPRFEVERRGELRDHYEMPPVTKKHLLPWPIEKIEAMEAMGASGADDKVAWERIAVAVGSSVLDAVDQWEAYCETMRRERWTASIRGVMPARDHMWVDPVSVAGGPPHWTGGQHHPWSYRADAVAVAAAAAAYPVPVRGGLKADVYVPTATSFGGGPPHPPATLFGRCSCCLKLWQTNSPTDAAALQSGSWVCPACQAGTRSGPSPPFWEDENGYIAVPREDITRAHPPPHVHVHRPPYFSSEAPAAHRSLRRPSWRHGRLPPSTNGTRGSGGPVPVGWDDEEDTEPVGPSRPPTSIVADRNNGMLPSAITPQEKGEGDKDLPPPERLLARAVTAPLDAETPRGRRARGGERAGASGDIAGGGSAADAPSLDPPAVMVKLSHTKAPAGSTSDSGTAPAPDAASCGRGEQQGVDKSSTSPTPAEANETALSRKRSLAPPPSSQPCGSGSVVGGVSADPPASAPPSGIEAVAVTAAAEVLRSLPLEKENMGDVGGGDDRKKEDAMEVEISRGEADAVKRGKDGSIRSGEGGGTGSPCDRGAVWVGGGKTHQMLYTPEAVEAILEDMMTKRGGKTHQTLFTPEALEALMMTKRSTERTDTLEETGYTAETCSPSRNATWSEEDVKRFLQAIEASLGEPDGSPREVDWEVVARKLRGRIPEQCRIRWSNLQSVRWTNEEGQPSQGGHKNETAVATGGECVDPTANPWASNRYKRTDGEGRGRGYEGGEISSRSIEEDGHGHRDDGRNQQDRRRRSPSDERGYGLPGQRMLGSPYGWHQGAGKPGDRRSDDAAAVDSLASERSRASTAAPRASHGGDGGDGGGGVHEDMRQIPRNPGTAREREDYEAGQQSRRPRNTQYEGADGGGSDTKPAWTHVLPPVYVSDRGWGEGSAQTAGALQRRVEGGYRADERQQQQQQRAMWSGRGIETKPETGASREKLLGVQEGDMKRTFPVEDRVRGPHRGDETYGWYRGSAIARLGSYGAGSRRYTEEQARERINQMQEEEERRLDAIEREHKRERERASEYERRPHGGDAPGKGEGRSGEMKVESHKASRGGVPGRGAGGGEGGRVEGFTPPVSGRRGRVEGGTSHHRRESPKGQLMSRVMMEGERKMGEVRRSSPLDGSENRVGWRFSGIGGGKTLQAKEEQPRGVGAGTVGGGGGSTAAAVASVELRKKAIDHLRTEG